MKTKEYQENKAITLIALIVTIIIMLILAGVSIAILMGDNGIISKTMAAKKQAEIAKEKEIIDLSTLNAIYKSKETELEQEKLEEALEYNIDKKERNFEVQVYDNKVNIKFFIVKFIDSKNVYMIEDGNNAEWIGNLNDTEDVIVPINLLYGLEDREKTVAYFIEYEIKNGAIIVTSKRKDGWGLTTGRIYLNEGKKYLFHCDVQGIWADINSSDTVFSYLAKNGSVMQSDIIGMNQMHYVFIPANSGTEVYHLRLDVNQQGKTYTFSNISVKLIIN